MFDSRWTLIEFLTGRGRVSPKSPTMANWVSSGSRLTDQDLLTFRNSLFNGFDEKQNIFILSNSITQEQIEEHWLFADPSMKLHIVHSNPDRNWVLFSPKRTNSPAPLRNDRFLRQNNIYQIRSPAQESVLDGLQDQLGATRLPKSQSRVDVNRFIRRYRDSLGSSFLEGGSGVMRSLLEDPRECMLDHFVLVSRSHSRKIKSLWYFGDSGLNFKRVPKWQSRVLFAWTVFFKRTPFEVVLPHLQIRNHSSRSAKMAVFCIF